VEWVGLDWVALVWSGLGIGLDCIGLDWVGLGWIGRIEFGCGQVVVSDFLFFVIDKIGKKKRHTKRGESNRSWRQRGPS
jgi:hypothetical protein